MDRKIYKGEGTILVIDDEEIVRFLIGEMIKELGYAVTSFENPLEAIEYYKHHYKEIDLVILDMNMPIIDGLETFQQLKKRNSKIKAIVLSGFSQENQIKGAKQQGIKGYITKPIDIYSLSKT